MTGSPSRPPRANRKEVTDEEMHHPDRSEGHSSCAHRLPDGTHHHELPRLRPLLKLKARRKSASLFLYLLHQSLSLLWYIRPVSVTIIIKRLSYFLGEIFASYGKIMYICSRNIPSSRAD